MKFIWEDKGLNLSAYKSDNKVRSVDSKYHMDFDLNNDYFSIYFYEEPTPYKYRLTQISKQ